MDEVEIVEDDPREVVGEASFRYTLAEFIAAYRAIRIAGNRSFDTRAWRIAVVALGHLLLIAGPAVAVAEVVRKGRLSPVALGGVLWAILGGALVYCWCYGYQRRMRKHFGDWPAADAEQSFLFRRGRLETHSPYVDSSFDWSIFPSVTELRDGFMLRMSNGVGVWIPGHAFRAPFDARAAASFLRSRAEKYKVVDRPARPSGGSGDAS